MKDIYSIGELVKQLNINKETIRYYERIGLISETTRDKNGYRIYTKEDIEKIKFILIVKNFGFSLKEISTLIHDEIICGDIKSIKKIVEDKVNEINNKINQLDATKRLLEKVKKNILDENIKCCDDIENYLKK
ncbi:MerR family transcriptional regulator [Clostridium sp.]|uniref:MerR family transcriptional regulator n=1 Tax=Clostridium sp. TaxID=1506 RepID=UPI002840CD17|nr:MerR family transcriptional regulator [Clostridium sp.]MDR3594043.1 MerR family transcriptional regulator [Clostridium sp.]